MVQVAVDLVRRAVEDGRVAVGCGTDRLQHIQRTKRINLKVGAGVGHAGSDGDLGSQVQDGVRVGVLGQQVVHRVRVADICPVELRDAPGAEPGQVGLGASTAEVVHQYDVMAGRVQPRSCMAADEPGTARDDPFFHGWDGATARPTSRLRFAPPPFHKIMSYCDLPRIFGATPTGLVTIRRNLPRRSPRIAKERLDFRRFRGALSAELCDDRKSILGANPLAVDRCQVFDLLLEDLNLYLEPAQFANDAAQGQLELGLGIPGQLELGLGIPGQLELGLGIPGQLELGLGIGSRY
jgi:hypothetical protein